MKLVKSYVPLPPKL